MPSRREGAGGRWIEETVTEAEGLRTSLRAERVLHEERSDHQDLVLFENRTFGRVLLLDGAIQVTTADEWAYHEMLAHVPLFAHGAARRVLVVGGGDCGLARQVLRHPEVERLVQVEIDPAVVEFSKTHFPAFTGPVMGDPRFELVIADAARFLAETAGESDGERFEAILVDSTDPQGPGAALFTRDFYAGCRGCLAPGGLLATQNGNPFLQAGELRSSVGHLRALFADAGCYLTAVPSYTGGHLALGWATDDPALRWVPEAELAARHRAAGDFPTRYWMPAVQRAAFALPRFIAEIVEG
ncbi:MAG: polyamine aminopropyltransferase [Tistlia sp.]|uniref:polyamine aminopropyltransferase n=1 Tax=Tistlia sp. TaxID=3057121 RepID=UPI0034A589CD